MTTYSVPGVHREQFQRVPVPAVPTGVPVVLGYTDKGAANAPRRLTMWPQYEAAFGAPSHGSYLSDAVRGFFDNGGGECFVVPLDPSVEPLTALNDGLVASASLDNVDLVAAPDVMRPRAGGALPPDPEEVARLQTRVLRHCDDTGGRFAILDSRPGATVDEVLAQRAGLVSVNGALYYPWVRTTAGPAPPCGHVAGVYARTDARVGVHKAPANEALEGVVDVEMPLTDAQQAVLNPAGVDCLRARPGRGIRVWGARTIATDPSWRYINARRLVLRVARWLERNGATAAFEVSEPRLWSQMTRDVNAYLMDLFRRGALAGRTPEEAFYVKCDAGTNPPDVRDAGLLVTEVGIAPTVPGEFLVVRITHGPAGVVAGAPTPSI